MLMKKQRATAVDAVVINIDAVMITVLKPLLLWCA
jgi:hypothetical protein